MRIHGYCSKCGRFRMCNVNPATLHRGRVPVGVCDRCEDRTGERR